MKQLSLLAAIAACIVFAVEARAQSMPSMKLHVNHSFAVGQNWLPAGEYRIQTLHTGSDLPVLAIQGEYGTVLVAANRSSQTVVEKTEAVFAERNNKLYLKRIKMAGRSYGFEVIGSPAVAAD
jgi:hypothetical protein